MTISLKVKYLLKWFLFYWVGEIVLLTTSFPASLLFILVSAAFFLGYWLRKFKLYPGKFEPLCLDALSGTFSLLSSLLIHFFPFTALKVILPLFLLSPHLTYILFFLGSSR